VIDQIKLDDILPCFPIGALRGILLLVLLEHGGRLVEIMKMLRLSLRAADVR